jgi:hypothetical protein
LKQLFEIDRDMRKLLNQPSDNNFFWNGVKFSSKT